MQLKRTFLEEPKIITNFRGKEGVNLAYIGEVTRPVDYTRFFPYLIEGKRSAELPTAYPIRLENGVIELYWEQGFSTVGELTDNGKTVEISAKGEAVLASIATTEKPLAHAKIRNGRVKLSALLGWIADALNALCPMGEFAVDEKELARFYRLTAEKTYHLYKTVGNGSYTVPQYSAIVGEVYALHGRTNTTSCMTKGVYDESEGQADFYDGKLHPFHSYNTADWDLFLLSDIAPNEMESWDKAKSPFLARSWGWTENANANTTPIYCNAGSSYGDSQASDVLNAILCDKGANYGAKIRMYGAYYDDVSMSYIDGYTQTVGADIDEPNSSADGYEYFHAVVCDRGDYDYTWQVAYTTGLAERVSREIECQISGELYDEDDMRYIESLDGYVHYEFYSYNAPDELDGLAILRHFHR